MTTSKTPMTPHRIAYFLTAIVVAVLLFGFSSYPLYAGKINKPAVPVSQKAVQSAVDPGSLARMLDSVVVPGLAKYHIPGMVIAIVHDSDIVLVKGYGYANVEQKTPFDPDNTVIRIASVSKLFTGTAVMQLVDRGMVDMNTDINNYLARFKVENWPGKPITLQHLLTHTAGFDDRYIGKSAWTQESQVPLGDFLAERLPARICPPGEVYTYSNFSNALAGFVVEEAANEDYATYVRHNILDPLRMLHSDYRLRPDLQPLLAQCYSHDGPGFHRNDFDFINDYPGGQMLSTGCDMAKFMIAHLQLGQYSGQRILSVESARAMHTVQFTHHVQLEGGVGYSFGVGSAVGTTVLMHDGGYTGVVSRLSLFPERKVGFFMACNIMDGALIEEVTRHLLEHLRIEPPKDAATYPLASIPTYDRNVADFAGSYRFSRYAHNNFEKMGVFIGMIGPEMKIGQNEEGMILMDDLFGKPRRMVQVRPCLFQSIDDGYMCAFRRDASGNVTHLFTNSTAAFEKIPWFETAMFQRILFAACLLTFASVSIVFPIVRKIRKKRQLSGLDVDPVRWFAQKTASTFLLYFLGLGIVMGLVIPQEEMAVGFAHGIHWAMYVVQTIVLAGILLLAGLVGSTFWRLIRGAERYPGEGWPIGIVTVIGGVAFVWFLWYWNLVGYRF